MHARQCPRRSLRANWKDLFGNYEKAFNQALATSPEPGGKLTMEDLRAEMKAHLRGDRLRFTHFRTFTAVASLPPSISRLRGTRPQPLVGMEPPRP